MNGGKIGQLRQRYQLQELLGRGGRGSVYRARDESLGRDVAIKVFDASATNHDDFLVQENEVNVLASLKHHSLVTLLDAGVDRTDRERPRIFFVMELVEGTDLKVKLEHGTLSARQIAEIGYDLAEGLEYIHHQGVVHRDIKPANILLVDYDVGTRQRAKLTDFGIAQVCDTARPISENATTGTAPYLSPEQVTGESLGSPSDVYSLGLVLLECFTGQIAFPGEPVLAALARLKIDPAIPADLDPTWRTLLAAMTARNPDDRPRIEDLVIALHQAIVAETGRHKSSGTAVVAIDEDARLKAVRRYQLLDTPPDGTFDRITAMAARVFSVPIAIVSVVDHDRIWFKSHHGIELNQIDRNPGLCASAILDNVPWFVEDARFDPRALSNPLVANGSGIQFYAGVPLRTSDGYNLGTLCVLGFQPRAVAESELATLEDLAALVMSELELRLRSRIGIGHDENEEVRAREHAPD
ncbi:MAG: protein kinase [Candidatus Saccharibacteria bacterium]|nr:protein kinase [Microbacteriaceae bacterium]